MHLDGHLGRHRRMIFLSFSVRNQLAWGRALTISHHIWISKVRLVTTLLDSGLLAFLDVLLEGHTCIFGAFPFQGTVPIIGLG